MPIIAKGNNAEFTPCPAGLHHGVCVDVVDKGMQTSKYGPRHTVQIRWVLFDAEPALPSGKPHMAVRTFGLSLGEKSALRPFLIAWRGRAFSPEELEAFDLEDLIGANAQVQILHNKVNDKVYANVQACLPLAKGTPKRPVPDDYVRECEREHRAELEANPDGGMDESYEESVPF